MWYDSFHCCDMIFQRVRDDGTVVYRCACGTVMEVSMTTSATSTSPLPQKPARTPVPAAFYKAFEGDDKDGVPL